MPAKKGAKKRRRGGGGGGSGGSARPGGAEGASGGALPPLSASVLASLSKEGEDTEGKVYASIAALWDAKLGRGAEECKQTDPVVFYGKGAAYWEGVEASDNGMLGGFAGVSAVDCRDSRDFLRALPGLHWGTALDCGAGIGRVTRALLLPLFDRVDIVEQNPAYVGKARQDIQDAKMGEFFCSGLQDFKPSRGRYDCIWIQWVIGQIQDDDLVHFLKRCQEGLRPGGFICVKDNTTRAGGPAFVYDCADHSVTRCDALYRVLFHRSNLRIVRTGLQKNFPKELFPVRMYALQPAGI